ncbi:MAG: MarR family transcriptional regulator [Firmicutes bacterium]|nr:MarR family transcriptional regulator [Bacillota bacterium]
MEKELQNKMALVQYMMQKKRKKEIKGEFDPTHGQGRILEALKNYDGISLRDLAYILDLAPSSMSEMLSKLEKKGYVTREIDEQDKRAQVIKLTDKAKSVEQENHHIEEDLFSCLTIDEQKSFGISLDKLVESLKIKLGYDDEKMLRKMNKVRG